MATCFIILAWKAHGQRSLVGYSPWGHKRVRPLPQIQKLNNNIKLVTILFLFLCFVFFGCEACGILASQEGIKPATPALEGEVLATRLPGKSRGIFQSTFISSFSFIRVSELKGIWSFQLFILPELDSISPSLLDTLLPLAWRDLNYSPSSE